MYSDAVEAWWCGRQQNGASDMRARTLPILVTLATVVSLLASPSSAESEAFTDNQISLAAQYVDLTRALADELRESEPSRFQDAEEARALAEFDAKNPDIQLSPEEALLREARAVAEGFGTSVDNALVQKVQEAQVGALLSDFETDLRRDDAFAGVFYDWQRDGYPEVRVRFKAPASQDSLEAPSLEFGQVQGFVDAVRKIDGVTIDPTAVFSVDDVRRVKAVLTSRSLDAAAKSVGVTFLMADERFEVYVQKEAGEDNIVTPEGLAAEVRAETGISVAASDVAVVEGTEPSVVPAKGYGGMKWNYDSDGLSVNGKSKCTSAFTVRKTGSSTEGMTSASHCENLVKLNDRYNGNWYNTYFQSEYFGPDGDFEWRTTTADDLPKFYTGYGLTTVTWRIPNSSISASGNQWVCHYGRTTQTNFNASQGQYKCGTVVDADWTGGAVHPSLPNTTFQHVVRVDNMYGLGGDSGGPVYAGGTAYGIYQGNPGGIREHSLFSKAQEAESHLGVYIQFG